MIILEFLAAKTIDNHSNQFSVPQLFLNILYSFVQLDVQLLLILRAS